MLVRKTVEGPLASPSNCHDEKRGGKVEMDITYTRWKIQEPKKGGLVLGCPWKLGSKRLVSK